MWAARGLLLLVVVVNPKRIIYNYGDGSYYIGSVDENGRPSGEGEFHNSTGQLTYKGNFTGGNWHGWGTWYGKHGDIYEGEFVGGQGDGRGTWYTDKNEMIVGEFKNHTVHGQATWYYGPDKSIRLHGSFKRGHVHGNGTMYMKNGRRYVGMFKKGYAHGLGKLLNEEGDVIFKGNFKNGVPEDALNLGEGDLDMDDFMNTEFPMVMMMTLGH